MIIRNILFCESANKITSGPDLDKNAVIEPTYAYQLAYIPTAFTFTIFIMAQGLPDVATEIRITFKKSDSETNILDLKYTLDETIPVKDGIPREKAGININVPLSNFPIEQEGEYECEVFIDNASQKKEQIVFFRK